MGALTPNRKALTVTDALVATDLDLASDVRCHLASKVTFDFQVRFDPVAEGEGLVVREVLGLHLRINTGGLQSLGCL